MLWEYKVVSNIEWELLEEYLNTLADSGGWEPRLMEDVGNGRVSIVLRRPK